jgi:DNA polymerase-3 subunit epsilon
MKLQKPLAFFDLETTGLDVTQDRIVEIAIVKLNPNGSTETFHQLVNPEMNIPPEIAEIHGITNEKVKNALIFRELAKDIADFIGEADLAGYNSNKFDIPVLAEEFLRAEHPFDVGARQFVDVQNIFHKMEQRTLAAAYQFYCQKELTNAHSALADVDATKEVLLAQLEKYKDLEDNISFLAQFSRVGENELSDFAGRIAKNKKNEAIYNFGKHKGKTILQVATEEPGYYGWMMSSNFPLFTKKVLKQEMEKIKSQLQPSVSSKTNKSAPNKTLKAKLNMDENFDDKIEELKKKFGK